MVSVAAFVGVAAWSGNPLSLPLALVFPLLWGMAGSRIGAALIAAAYFLGASRGLPAGVSIFFGSDLVLGLALWVAASSAFVGVHAFCWCRQPSWRKPVGYLVANVLMSVPPLGIVGWANPITAAGITFPGWGWWGLGATAVLLMVTTTRLRWSAIGIICGLAILSVLTWSDPVTPPGWRGINTIFVSANDQYADYEQQLATFGLVKEAAAAGARVVILPESALGIWTATTQRLWRNALADLDTTVIGGAVILGADEYENLMMHLNAEGAEVLYRQRMPVPVSMWQPWTEGGAKADFFGNPVVKFEGARLSVLLCYEQLLIWPVLHSMLLNPDVIVAPANGWWTGSTNIVPIQKAAMVAWARLFDRPLVMAFNTPKPDVTR